MEGNRFSPGIKGPLITGQKGVSPGNRAMQIDLIPLLGLSPIPHVGPGEFHIVDLLIHPHGNLTQWGTGNKVVQHTATIDHPLADGVEVQDIRHNRLVQGLDFNTGIPGGLAQPIGQLKPLQLLGKEPIGHFTQTVGFQRANAKA